MSKAERLSITASGALLFIVSVYIFRDLSSFVAAQGASGILEVAILPLFIELALGAAAGIGMYFTVMKYVGDVPDLLKKIKVLDVYLPADNVVNSDAPIEEARKIIAVSPTRSAVVINGDRGIVGVLSDYDLSFKPGVKVRDLMTSPAVAVSINESLLDAYRLMRMTGLNKLPVYEEKNGKRIYKGYITLSKILDEIIKAV